jgi:hypothetical protein
MLRRQLEAMEDCGTANGDTKVATRARTYRQWVVFSIEKNRDGPALVDLEFRKDFANFRFESHGSFVAEQLVDDVLFEE